MRASWAAGLGICVFGTSLAHAGLVEFTGSGVFSFDYTSGGVLDGSDLDVGNAFAVRIVIDTSTPIAPGENPEVARYLDSIVEYSFSAGGASITGDVGGSVVAAMPEAVSSSLGFSLPLGEASFVSGDFNGLGLYYINVSLNDSDHAAFPSVSLIDALDAESFGEVDEANILLSFSPSGAVFGEFDQFVVRAIPAPGAAFLIVPVGYFLVGRRR